MSVELELANLLFNIETFKEELEQRQPVTHLRLHINMNFTIIKEIAIHSQCLSQLQFLNLGYNKIVSLQALTKMSLLNLQELHLFSNNISCVRSLKKCPLPKLKFISLANNNLNRLEAISQWNCPNLEQVVAYDNRISCIPSLLRTNCDGLRSICFGDEVDQNLLFIGCLLARFSNYYNYDQIGLLSDSDESVD